jgi:hypothetical protein
VKLYHVLRRHPLDHDAVFQHDLSEGLTYRNEEWGVNCHRSPQPCNDNIPHGNNKQWQHTEESQEQSIEHQQSLLLALPV